MSVPKIIRGRYEIKDAIGHGGMGIVYRAFDPVMRRDVAVKTLHDVASPTVLDLFYRECDILRGIVHPNIVDILDMGDYEEGGVVRPYYVMPLLPGKTLYDLLHPTRDTSEPLSVNRTVEVIAQTARGLHAAHERELLHRDVKPRNIFVIDEYSVKLIDFGVAHLLGGHSSTGVKGTLDYMSPEQLKMKPLSRQSDIFSIAVVCYECLTGRQIFHRDTAEETAAALVNWHPPLACNVNPSVPKAISQVVSKAMAKDPWSRFATASEFAEALQRARHNESLTHLFDPDEARARLGRARQSFEQKDFQFAAEVLRELETEGHADTEVRALRRKVDDAILQENTKNLFDSAERYFQAGELALAQRQVQGILELNAEHAGALALRSKIEEIATDRKIAELMTLASERLEQAAFSEARRALQDALKLRPEDARVRAMLTEVDGRQKDFLKHRQEQERLYQASQAAWIRRDISLALNNLEKLAELARKTPEPRERIAEYNDFYKVVQREHDALLSTLRDAREKAAREEFGDALALCAQYAAKYPQHAGLIELKAEIEESQAAAQTAFRQEVERRLMETPSLERKADILEVARKRYPQDTLYPEQLRHVRELQAEVAAAVEAAQVAEQAGDFEEALKQWSRLPLVYPDYPGLQDQVLRITDARAKALEAAKAAAEEDILEMLRIGDLERAEALLQSAFARFPGQFEELATRLAEIRELRERARNFLEEARLLAASGHLEDALGAFQRAHEAGNGNLVFLKSVLDAMAKQAADSAGADWRAASRYIEAAQSLDRAFITPPAVAQRIQEAQRAEFVAEALASAGSMEETADFKGALKAIDNALSRFPREPQLVKKREALERARLEDERRRARAAALRAAQDLERRAIANLSNPEIDRLLDDIRALSKQHSEYPELLTIASDTGRQLLDLRQSRAQAASEEFDAARTTANRYLQRFPTHPGFADVLQQVAERERQIATEYMASVNTRLLHEPNMDRRIDILEEAQRRYPNEPHYAEELGLIRHEQQMVQSIVEEARSLETAGHFKDALEQWNRLRAIYRIYPGLDEQIARLMKLHEEAMQAAKERWSEQIEQAFRQADYNQARELAQKADQEFPGDFKAATARAQDCLERRSRAQRCISEAQDLAGKNQWEDCQARLRQSIQAAPGDSVIALQVQDAHIKLARAAVRSRFTAAEALLAQASELDPAFREPPDLRARIDENKRAQAVERALTASRKLQQSGQLQPALDAILETLSRYPAENSLLQRKAVLEASLREAAIREERRRVLEELRGLESLTRTIVNPRELDRVLTRVQDLAGRHNDKEIHVVSGSIREQVEALRSVRDLLRDGKFDEAERLTDQMLTRFEDHTAFAALKSEIAEARKQAEAAYLVEIVDALQQTRDLPQREKILLEASGRYPNEPYYQTELELVRQTQQLVEQVIAEARRSEDSGNFEAALDLWKRLGAIDRGHPNLDREIERVSQRITAAQIEAAAPFLSDISKALDQGDIAAASRLLERAEQQCGAVIGSQSESLRARIEALTGIETLLQEGRDLLKRGEYAQAAERLRLAAVQAASEPRMFDIILAELLQAAESVLTENWQIASAILATAATLAPENEVLASLSGRVEQRRVEQLTDQVLAECGTLREKGDLAGEEKTIRAALAIHNRTQSPARFHRGDVRLRSRLAEVQALIAEQRRRQESEQIRRSLDSIAAEAATAGLNRLRRLQKQIRRTAETVQTEDALREHAATVARTVAARIFELESAAHPRSRRKILYIGAGAAAVAVTGIVAVSRLNPKITVLTVNSEPGASISIGDKKCVTPNCILELPPGGYVLAASKPGYRDITRSVTVSPGQKRRMLTLVFEPLPEVLQVNTNFESGRVWIDGITAGGLRDGQFTQSPIQPGRHSVKIDGGGATFEAEWESAPGQPPKLLPSSSAQEVQAAVIANAGAMAAVSCNCGVQTLSVDGSPAGKTKPSLEDSVPLQGMTEGSHRIMLGGRQLVAQIGPNPAVSVFLVLDRNVGTLVIDAGPENARIYINNRLSPKQTERSAVRLLEAPGTYSVRVAEDGFQPSESKTVQLAKGEEKPLTFKLVSLPAILEVAGAVSRAQVHVDGAIVGTVDSSGAFRGEVRPGEHEIQLTLDDYNPATFRATFIAGRSVRPTAAQLAMTKIVHAPDPVQVEAQDFERVRLSDNEGEIQDFLRRHPNGAHAPDARARLDRLRQQAQDKKTLQDEQLAWDRLDKNNKAALQDFINANPNGAHKQQAQRLIDEITSREVVANAKAVKDKQDASAKEAKSKQDAALQGDILAVQQTLSAYAAAYQTALQQKSVEPLRKYWPSMPTGTKNALRDDFSNARTISLTLTPQGTPMITGDEATVVCRRVTTMTRAGGPPVNGDNLVTVVLNRMPSGWIIISIY